MNAKSKICSKLAELSTRITVEDTEQFELLKLFREEYPEITIKVDYPLVIFNYAIGADFTNPVVQEARGIIINVSTLDVVCWPFRKFGRYDEPYADSIDWSSARVLEKIDGSIIKLWFNPIRSEWAFSSNSCIDAEDAVINQDTGMSLIDIILESVEWKYAMNENFFDELDRDKTYILELTSPYNRVVVPYKDVHLYHTGTRHNVTGLESNDDIGLPKPNQFNIHSIGECLEYVGRMNVGYGRRDARNRNMVSSILNEEFVVVDDNWNRIKIKTPEYMVMHSIVSVTKESKRQLIQLLNDNMLDIESLSFDFPDLAHILKYYDYKMTEFVYQAKAVIRISRRLYRELNGDRKAVANRIKKSKYSPFGFKAIGNDIPEDEIIREFGFNKIIKYIPDYVGEDNSYMFRDTEGNEQYDLHKLFREAQKASQECYSCFNSIHYT